jgi:hypothetical protein
MSWLHFATMSGDILLAHEPIRLGTAVGLKDGNGRTPLGHGCTVLSRESNQLSWTIYGRAADLPVNDDMFARLTVQIHSIERVCMLLISQRADINETHNSISLLHPASKAASWDLICCLLEHGADPTPSSLPEHHHPIYLFKRAFDKQRFHHLTQKYLLVIYHPSSSKLLLECHADGGEDKPYPDDFICRCKSRKLYVNCCKKRGILRWDNQEEWMQSCTKQSIILKGSPAKLSSISCG